VTIKVDENNLKYGLLGLTVALVEVICDTLKHQAFRRMDSGFLTEEEIERLGSALMDLDKAVEDIKQEQGIAESVQVVREGLDEVADEFIDKIINPQRWGERDA
jgi:hypothetical protein